MSDNTDSLLRTAWLTEVAEDAYQRGLTRARQEVAFISLAIGLFYTGRQLFA